MPQSVDYLAKGLVLAFNCVPEDVDPNIKSFWEALCLSLEQKGFFLVIATTTPLSGNVLKTIEVPYNLSDLYLTYNHVAETENDCYDLASNHNLLTSFSKHFSCDEDIAKKCISLGCCFLQGLIDAFLPCAIIGWQSTDINTLIVKRYADTLGIPFWSGERGFLKNTLMFDLGDNSLSSELFRSPALRKIYKSFSLNNEHYQQIKSEYTSGNISGKYKSRELVSNEELRHRYNIEASAKMVVLFLHGEPGLTACDDNTVFSKVHGLNKIKLLSSINALIDACERNNTYLLIQDHPLNKFRRDEFAIKESKFSIKVDENVHSLLRSADAFLFTTSTIQYEAVFYEKPIGLLSKSLLCMGDEGAFYLNDFQDENAFLTCLLDRDNWGNRQESLSKWVVFIYDYYLIKLNSLELTHEADRIAELLSVYENPVTDEFGERLEIFLNIWK